MELHQRRDLVGDGFGRVVVAEVEAEDEVAGLGVGGVEFLRADDVFLAAEAEEFSFDGVDAEFPVDGFVGEDRVVGLDEAFARRPAVGGGVFGAVGYPVIMEARGAEFLGEVLGDAAAGLGVIDPEAADGFVGVGEGKAGGGFRVGEIGGVEIEADRFRFGPIEPAGEVLGLERVAVDVGVAGFGVERVEVEALLAGKEFQDDVQVGAHFVAVAGATRVAAGGHDAAGVDGAFGGLETADVIGLPAVEGDGDFEGAGEGGFGVDAEVGVGFAGEFVGGGDLFGRSHGRGSLELKAQSLEQEAARCAASAVLLWALSFGLWADIRFVEFVGRGGRGRWGGL